MSTLQAFVAWRRQRLPLLQFVGVALVVAAAAGDVGVVTTAVALLWIGAFRLWDDVTSRDADARRHPDRVVVRGPRAPFARAATVAVAIGAVVAAAVSSWSGYAALVVFVAAVSAVPTPSLARQLLILMKYPAMATLLASTTPSLAGLGLLYSCFVVDELISGEAPLPARALPFALTFFFLSAC